MTEEAREALVSHLSHELERWFGPNIAGWPENPTKYFGTPARLAVEAAHAAGVREGIRQAREAARREVERQVDYGPNLYPEDVLAAIDALEAEK